MLWLFNYIHLKPIELNNIDLPLWKAHYIILLITVLINDVLELTKKELEIDFKTELEMNLELKTGLDPSPAGYLTDTV